MTGTENIRIGLVGYGKGGRYFHAPLLAGADGCELAGAVTLSPERRHELARDFPEARPYASLAELVASGVDAVVVTTPVDTHMELVHEAIALRTPVVCDKPFALDAASAREAVTAAEQAGVLLTVYQNRRWDADFRTVARLVDSGELGTVARFESRMEQYRPQAGLTPVSGGLLRDFGSHVVDQAMWLFGPVSSVYAEKDARADLDGLDTWFFASLHHRDGVTSHLWGDLDLQGGPGWRFRVTGSGGTFAVESDDGQADQLLGGRTPASEGAAWGSVPEERWGRLYRAGTGETVPSEQGDWTRFYAGLAAAVRGYGPLPVDPWDSVATLEVLDAARTSAEKGQVVEIGR
ncbi:Gfo/Idh/MocA family oxidoreductase [Haloechinothrix sp. YIM 98757]|uniref:Gfo/Idh/MocA family oxidoreductase n=1 Tax=Haloechinothrix aidingensis TaxID=2752311 RepID=A0A838A812_9PSEU|nr:Gfo/Idh/MocA family oxidoreductase [Haloechinothrix aidingensis]MBA0124551.1 Gfo/Idh/MocA family oxidoreductase [Haloechinothrix aidingensis]